MKFIKLVAIAAGVAAAGILVVRMTHRKPDPKPDPVPGTYVIASNGVRLDRNGSRIALVPSSASASWTYSDGHTLKLAGTGPFITSTLFLSDFADQAGVFTLQKDGKIKIGNAGGFVGIQAGFAVVSDESNAAIFTFEKQSGSAALAFSPGERVY